MEGRVFITGSASGIGSETARQLADLGYQVWISARDHERAAGVAADIGSGVRAWALDLDVTDPDSVAATAAALSEEGGLDVLVNNAAGYVDWSELASSADLDVAHQVVETNLFGAWRMTNALLPLLAASAHPRVVHVSSGGGSHADEAFGLTRRGGRAATYGISKAALNALTATQAAELADTPIMVNAVCPGLTATWPGAESMGARPVADGARSVVWAVTLPDDGPRGGLFRDGQPLGW